MQRLSPFTLIVTFVCLALVGLALVPMLPVKLNPSRTLPGFTVRFSMPGTSSCTEEKRRNRSTNSSNGKNNQRAPGTECFTSDAR